jgi:hypothetical protein
MDWRSWFGLDPAKNPYLRLSEADRLASIKKVVAFMLGVVLFLWILSFFHWGL